MKVILYKYKGKIYSDKPFNTKVVDETYDKGTLTVYANCKQIINFFDVLCFILAIVVILFGITYKPVPSAINVNPNSYYNDGKLYCNMNYDIPEYLNCAINLYDDKNDMIYSGTLNGSGLIQYIEVPESTVYKVDAYLKLFNIKISKNYNVIISSEVNNDNGY